MSTWNRRTFIKSGALGTAAFTLLPLSSYLDAAANSTEEPRFKISLAQWSFHKALQSKKLDHLDFPKKATELGIYAVEYVNQFFKDKATDSAYLAKMNRRTGDLGVRQVLIMVDGEGGLAEPDNKLRAQAVVNHYKWIDAAKILGCHSIRVNAFGESSDPEALHSSAVASLSTLAAYAAPMGINVIVENHGGISSDAMWMMHIMKEVNMPNCGTLPDFGNFCIREEVDANGVRTCLEEYDRYRGVQQLLSVAKGVSAKSYDFDDAGNETTIDFTRMVDLIKKSKYSGYIGIEYEGSRLSEEMGIAATKKLLERLIS